MAGWMNGKHMRDSRARGKLIILLRKGGGRRRGARGERGVSSSLS